MPQTCIILPLTTQGDRFWSAELLDHIRTHTQSHAKQSQITHLGIQHSGQSVCSQKAEAAGKESSHFNSGPIND